jgi:Ca2+/Na+ antiporter
MSKKFIIAIVVLVMAAIVGKFVMQDNNLLYYSAILAIVAALFIAYVNMRDKTKTREKDRKIRENKEKYKRVSGVLRTFVRKFNDPYLLDILTKGETRISRLI